MKQISPEEKIAVLLVSDDHAVLEFNRLLLLNAGIGPVFALTDSRTTLPFLEQQCVSVIKF